MLLTIFILSVTLAAVVFYLTHALKKQHFDNLTNEDSKKNTDLLDETRQKAVGIIDEANSKALDIINKANLSADITSENFTQEVARIASLQIKDFEKATSDFTKMYNRILQELKSKNIEVFQNVSKDIEVNTMEEIKNFRDSVENLTVSSQKQVKKKIDDDYREVEREIENYKQEQLKKVDDKIYEILERVSKLALGRAISLSEHENLITKALERAKKEGAFTK